MAPRGRSRRVGLTRMDAAVDALSQMGFSPDLVRNKVKYLIKEVYGHAEAWRLIEEDSYRVVIDSILDDQQKKCEPVPELLSLPPAQPHITSSQDSALHEDPALNIPLHVQEQSSWLLDACVLSSLPPPQTQNPAFDERATGNRTLDVQEQIPALLVTCEHSPPPGLEHLSQQQEPRTAKPRRKPCLGWIGNKKEDDFVLLEPMPVEGQEQRHRGRRTLKSRWDEKPTDDYVH